MIGARVFAEPAEPSRPASVCPLAVATKIFAGLLSVLLIGLGAVQIADSIEWLYTRSAIDPDHPTALNSANDRAAIHDLKAIDRRYGDPAARIAAGELERQSAILDPSNIDRVALKLAADDLADALARAPADARGWAELAAAQLAMQTISKARSAWRMSISAAAYEPSLNLWRVQIGMQFWLALDAHDRDLINQQIQCAWVSGPSSLVDYAKHAPFAARVIRSAMGRDDSMLKDFDRALAGG